MPTRLAVWGLAALAFVLRVVAGWRDEQAVAEQGYSIFLDIARTLLDGHGLCVEPGADCAIRPPVYSLLIAPFVAAGGLHPWLVILQAAIGASLVWIAYTIGTRLFDRRTALVAASLTAINPYTVVHDTALQETVVFNALIALAVLWLLRAASAGPAAGAGALAAGCALAFAALTTSRMLLFVPVALLWVWWAGPTEGRLRRLALVALPLLVLHGAWTLRNWRVVGAPVLTSNVGEEFWIANNAYTFDFYPTGSIDLSSERSIERLTPPQKAALDALQGREAERDRLLAGWGLDDVKSHPGQVPWAVARKLWAAGSGQLSPARTAVVQWGYAVFFVPIHALAAVGLLRSVAKSSRHLLVGLLFASFAITSGVFYAHTSHKSFLDLFLFIYAASVVMPWLERRVAAPMPEAVPAR